MIAYDTNILIYALEGTDEWAEAAQAVVRQGEQEGAVLSVLAWQELVTGVVLQGKESSDVVTSVLEDLTATKFVPVTQQICERAAVLTQMYGKQLFGYDAVHLATALEHRASVFLTNDKQLLRFRIDGLTIKGLQLY